jgi:hypothetical protein
MKGRVSPGSLIEDPGPQEMLGEEAGDARKPHDLGVPAAENVVGAVMPGIDGEGAKRLVPDQDCPADLLLRPHH